jgi:hypothetical protein
MLSPIIEDQIIAQEQTRDQTATDDGLPFVDTSTGQVDGSSRQGFPALRKLAPIGLFATLLGPASTPALAQESSSILVVAEAAGESRSTVAQALSAIADRYESVLFSYPARILEIERNVSGDPVSVAILVSVDGNDTVIKRPVRQLGFDPKSDMRLIVDGVQRGGTKQLAFRVAQPLPFDEEQEALLESIVSAFKTGTDA